MDRRTGGMMGGDDMRGVSTGGKQRNENVDCTCFTLCPRRSA